MRNSLKERLGLLVSLLVVVFSSLTPPGCASYVRVPEIGDVPDEAEVFLFGMTRFKGESLNYDTNVLIFNLYTDLSEEKYFQELENETKAEKWSLVTTKQNTRWYAHRKYSVKVSYTGNGKVNIELR
jgi:hypothetical protein